MEQLKNHQHFIIYKPYGYLSQFTNNQTRRTNKRLLGELYDFPTGTMAIGRLDEKSEGLLLLTTNGQISDYINSNKIEKEYFAQVDGITTEEAIEKLNLGVEISLPKRKTKFGQVKYRTNTCRAFKLDVLPILPERRKKIRAERHGSTSWVSIALREGKFRQVRKMTAAVGFPTLRLVRIRIGNIKLEKMKPGEVIEVDNFKEIILNND